MALMAFRILTRAGVSNVAKAEEMEGKGSPDTAAIYDSNDYMAVYAQVDIA